MTVAADEKPNRCGWRGNWRGERSRVEYSDAQGTNFELDGWRNGDGGGNCERSGFQKELRAGAPKLGLFLNSHSPTVAEQLAHSGYDWLLVDTQHGPMGYERLSAMLSGISNGGAKSMVRVGGYDDRPGIQQALDMGADGVLVPYINTAAEARQAVSCTKYPTAGTRSVYFPQRSMNKAGLLDTREIGTPTASWRCKWRPRIASRTSMRSRRYPAWTFCFWAK